MADIQALTRRGNALLQPRRRGRGAVREMAAPARGFSVFESEDLDRAFGLVMAMQAAVRRAGDTDTGLAAALGVAEQAAEDDWEMAAHATRLFNTHVAEGRRLRLERPIETMADVLVPVRRMAVPMIATTSPLAYWLEDPLANEHHLHWHVVYPSRGRPRPDIPDHLIDKWQATQGDTTQFTNAELNQIFRYQDRHGELFFYMHQQMLARYDSELLANGLELLSPIGPELSGEPIAHGYDVDPALEQVAPGFRDRQDDQTIKAEPAQRMHNWATAFGEAIDAGEFRDPAGGSVPIGIDLLGINIEAGLRIFRGGVDLAAYGNLHNAGHNFISALSPAPGGVIRSTAHAIRDTAFWRWHRFIDDFAFRWQETQPKLDFSDRPPVVIAKGADAWSSPDILLLPMLAPDGDDEAGRAALTAQLEALPDLAAAAQAGIATLDTLTTRMRIAQVALPDGGTRRIQHLSHEPFMVAVRLQNPSAAKAHVTVRLFLCPAANLDRRLWMELDKFLVEVPAGGARVAVRFDRESEVVKKPIDIGPDVFVPAQSTDDARCSCGWPYPLLLPRGTTAGMPFRLMAVVTDSVIDGFAATHHCGSVSFCGASEVDYPDRREMGYPFNRRWTTSIETAALNEPSTAARSLTIRHEPLTV